MRRLVAAFAGAAVALVLWAAPAAAHASLESTVPAGGSVLAESPEEVLLTFTEAVDASPGAIQVFDSNADRVDEGDAGQPDGRRDQVVQDLPADLSDGSYVVTWRVVSADGHPIHGAFTFQVGDVATGDSDALARRLLAADGGSGTVGALYAFARFAIFVALLLLVGAGAFCLVAWPEGLGMTTVRRLLWWVWGVAVGATLLGIGAHGAYVGALPLSDVVEPDVISSVLDARYGQMALARLALLVVVGVALWISRRRTEESPVPGPLGQAGVALVGVGLLLAPGLAGHASSGRLVPAAVVADAVHLGAAALWLGGLVVVLGLVLPRRRPQELATVVPRFSSLAFGAVAVLVVTGSFQAWRQVGSLDALTSTSFGRLLSAKVALFVVMVGFGFLGRRWVQRGLRGDGGSNAADEQAVVAGYRRAIRVETALGVVILAVTALLVNAPPARSALAQPYAAQLQADELLIDLTIDPAKVGTADIHLYTLTPTGSVADVQELTLEMTLPSEDIGPLEVPLERAGPGHFSAYDYDLPIAGDWQLEVVALIDDFTEARAEDTVEVRG